MIFTTAWHRPQSFQLPELDTCSHIALSIQGVFGVATLQINGENILTMDNFFRTYTIPLEPKKHSRAQISIQFHDLKAETQARSKAWQTPMDENGFSYTHMFRYPMIRQPAYACGWDWRHPIDTPSSIQKITLIAESNTNPFASRPHTIQTANIRCENVFFNTTFNTDFSCVKVAPKLTIAVFHPMNIHVEIYDSNQQLLTRAEVAVAGTQEISLDSFEIKHPKLWYPRTMGTPALTAFTLRIDDTDAPETCLTRTVNVGFKQVRICPMTPESPYLQFEINGLPCPIRGANWIPTHTNPTEEDPARTHALLQLATTHNFNTLRVWGGGFYPSETFLTECDNLGILVWQDFMFACNLYPEVEDMRHSVQIEAEEQVRRIRAHACILCFCGNNEVLSAYYEWLRTAQIPYFHGGHYFYKLLPECVAQNAPEIPYIPGSPFDPFTRETPGSNTAGDRHAWQCFFGDTPDKKDFHLLAEDPSRFISEFGFIAPPFPQSIPESDATFEYLDAQSNYGIPLARLRTYIAQVYPEERISDDLKIFCLQGLRAQALMVQHAVAAWRARGNYGVLVWHYNDISIAPSWGMIDGAQRPRPVLAMLQKIFAPIFIHLEAKDGHFRPQLCTDDSAENLSLEIRHYTHGKLSDTTKIQPDSIVCAIAWHKGKCVAQNVIQFNEKHQSFIPHNITVRPLNTKVSNTFRYEIISKTPLMCVIPYLDNPQLSPTFTPSAIDLVPEIPQHIELTLSSPETTPPTLCFFT